MTAAACEYDIIVIGGGHAGVEAAWAAARLGARTALITMDPTRIAAMSCNPAIGGLAKGQMVREIDALGGLMALAADQTGLQFRMLNASKGPAVWGPRCQSDKYRYARCVQAMLAETANLTILPGTVDELIVEGNRSRGVMFRGRPLHADAVVLTTGTFMRGLMHTGERKTAGGRVGEGSAEGISGALRRLGFDLGRLKTGTPPRLAAESLDLASLPVQPGDDQPQPFSSMTDPARFPLLPQRDCWITHTSEAIHDLIRANLHRAPMYNGQIETTGPRYCPSIEDKVVRFADRRAHHVFLEPESLETSEIYCNGISTSLPADVQEQIVHQLAGCARAVILRPGYAVEYDMVWPHQIDATTMTKVVEGLFLAGQINGTSGYEEAAGQGLMAGLNAVRFARGQALVRLGREQAYIGVMMDDLVTRIPREPYRMFTSRAEHRLLLRADNADARLTPLGREWDLVDDARWTAFVARREAGQALTDWLMRTRREGQRLLDWCRRPEVDIPQVLEVLNGAPLPAAVRDPAVIRSVLAGIKYDGYLDRQQQQIDRLKQQEHAPLPTEMDYTGVAGLRTEAKQTLSRFRPSTFGQASRLAGITPADLMVLTLAVRGK